MAHDVFISYSNKDKPIAESVCHALEARGIGCWIAPRNVDFGDYAASIVRAIADCRIMVLIFSSDSNSSKFVLREITTAVNKNVTIVPFRIHDVPLSDSLEFFISGSHMVDAIPPPLEPHLTSLADAIHRKLGPSAMPTGATAPPTAASAMPTGAATPPVVAPAPAATLEPFPQPTLPPATAPPGAPTPRTPQTIVTEDRSAEHAEPALSEQPPPRIKPARVVQEGAAEAPARVRDSKPAGEPAGVAQNNQFLNRRPGIAAAFVVLILCGGYFGSKLWGSLHSNPASGKAKSTADSSAGQPKPAAPIRAANPPAQNEQSVRLAKQAHDKADEAMSLLNATLRRKHVTQAEASSAQKRIRSLCAEALEKVGQALALDPNTLKAQQASVLAYLARGDEGDTASARRSLEAGLAAHPSDAELLQLKRRMESK